MRYVSRDAGAVPPCDVGRIGVAPSCGPSRIRRLLRLKQDCLAPPQRDPRISFGTRDMVVNALPPNLLFVLAVVGMKSAEKSPGGTLGKLRMLRDKLMGGWRHWRQGKRSGTHGRACGRPSRQRTRSGNRGCCAWPCRSSRHLPEDDRRIT